MKQDTATLREKAIAWWIDKKINQQLALMEKYNTSVINDGEIESYYLKEVEQTEGNTDDYTPFGAEWQKEMAKLTKAELIAMLRKALITKQENTKLKESNKELLKALELIQTWCEESGLKDCAIDNKQHMAIYHSLHLAKAAIEKAKQHSINN